MPTLHIVEGESLVLPLFSEGDLDTVFLRERKIKVREKNN